MLCFMAPGHPGEGRKCGQSSHFAMHIWQTQLQSGLACGLEVATTWFDILSTGSVLRCGSQQRPHECLCLHTLPFIWAGRRLGLPRITSWGWTSVRAVTHRHLCRGWRHLSGASWLPGQRRNGNPGRAERFASSWDPSHAWMLCEKVPGWPGYTTAAVSTPSTVHQQGLSSACPSSLAQHCGSQGPGLAGWHAVGTAGCSRRPGINAAVCATVSRQHQKRLLTLGKDDGQCPGMSSCERLMLPSP